MKPCQNVWISQCVYTSFGYLLYRWHCCRSVAIDRALKRKGRRSGSFYCDSLHLIVVCWKIIVYSSIFFCCCCCCCCCFKSLRYDPPIFVRYGYIKKSESAVTLLWRHNGRDNVSNHQPHDCLLNRLFRRRSKKTLKLRVTDLCARNSPGTGEFPAQMTSNAENVSIWWRHHDKAAHFDGHYWE